MARVRVLLVMVVVVISMMSAPVAAPGGEVVPASTAPECDYPLTITDGTEAEVTIDAPPEEIVVMHASGAQVAQDIGVWDRVTGAPVTPFTAYLEEHDAPTDVTDDEGFPVVEVIVDLDPDLVIAGHVADTETVATLRDRGLTVYTGPPPADVEDIRQKVLTYGALLDACDAAAERASWMDDRLEDVEARLDGMEERPLAYYELGDGWTTGEGTFQHDLIERAGADNLGAEAGLEGWAIVDEEVVVAMDPDFIVYGDATDEPLVSDAIRETPAMQQNRTVMVDSNLVNQAGPRVVLVIETMAEAFSDGPIEAVDEADREPDETDDAPAPNGADEETVESPDDEPEVTTQADDDDTAEALPGFGAIAAIIAISAGVLRVRRR